jgi:hypothetical protein
VSDVLSGAKTDVGVETFTPVDLILRRKSGSKNPWEGKESERAKVNGEVSRRIESGHQGGRGLFQIGSAQPNQQQRGNRTGRLQPHAPRSPKPATADNVTVQPPNEPPSVQTPTSTATMQPTGVNVSTPTSVLAPDNTSDTPGTGTSDTPMSQVSQSVQNIGNQLRHVQHLTTEAQVNAPALLAHTLSPPSPTILNSTSGDNDDYNDNDGADDDNNDKSFFVDENMDEKLINFFMTLCWLPQDQAEEYAEYHGLDTFDLLYSHGMAPIDSLRYMIVNWHMLLSPLVWLIRLQSRNDGIYWTPIRANEERCN